MFITHDCKRRIANIFTNLSYQLEQKAGEFRYQFLGIDKSTDLKKPVQLLIFNLKV